MKRRHGSLLKRRAVQSVLAAIGVVACQVGGAQAQINENYFDGTWVGTARFAGNTKNPAPYFDPRVCPSRAPSAADLRRLPLRLEVSSLPNPERFGGDSIFTGVAKRGVFNGTEWTTTYSYSARTNILPELHELDWGIDSIPAPSGAAEGVTCSYTTSFRLLVENGGASKFGGERILTCENKSLGIISSCFIQNMEGAMQREGGRSRGARRRR